VLHVHVCRRATSWVARSAWISRSGHESILVSECAWRDAASGRGRMLAGAVGCRRTRSAIDWSARGAARIAELAKAAAQLGDPAFNLAQIWLAAGQARQLLCFV